jgi:signal transduction histidine kinase
MVGQSDVSIAVADTGTELDASKVDHIFDAFFTPKPEGMGMGLSICRLIVKVHGGRLWASPNSPGGECLSVHCAGRGQPALRSGKLSDSAR